MCQDNYTQELGGELDRGSGLEWNEDDMKVHQQKMLDIIISDKQ